MHGVQRCPLRLPQDARRSRLARDLVAPVRRCLRRGRCHGQRHTAGLRTVWTRAAHRYPNSQWDLDARLHRGAFEDVLTSESQCSATLAAALYDTMPKQWVPVPGAVELLRVLKSRGHQVGLLSNTALDVRPRLAELGLLAYLDTVVLSFEEGLVKPDPRIFRLAADRLGIPADQCVFVGDTPQVDGDAVHAGMTSLLVPITGDIPQLQTAATLLIGTQ